MQRLRIASVLILGLSTAGCGGRQAASVTPAPPPATPPPSASDHRYKVPAEVGLLVTDAHAFAALATPVRNDLEADLVRGLSDPQATKDREFLLAMLDALDGHWPEAVSRLDRIRALETEPRAKVMTGLSIRIWADTIARGDDSPSGFRAAMERIVATLPLQLVRDDLSMLRTMGQVFTAEVCRQLVNETIGPLLKDGTIGFAELGGVVFQRYAVVRLVQVGAHIDAVLGAHGISANTQ
jgi:hypothetical protein